MKVIRSMDEVKKRTLKSGLKFQSLIGEPEARNNRTFVVTFLSGKRTEVHNHPHEQIYFILSGKAVFGFPSNEVIVPKDGLVFVSPGEKHFHGATEDGACSQLVIFINPSQPSQS